jgi:uncharacterized protein (TIGR04255 family)
MTMTETPNLDDLPSFERPPVTEVALSIQFASITRFRTVHVGMLWQEFRATFPKVSEQPPLVPVFETFGATSPSGLLPFRVEAFMTPPMPRFWFESADGVHLLQVQQDRFMHNWRKFNSSENVYPRYEPIRDRFRDEIERVSEFLRREDLGPIQPNQCELVYTNAIVLPDGTDPHAQLDRITPLWRRWQHDTDLAPLENGSLSFRYLIRSQEIPLARVYVEFQPGRLASDATPAIKLDITVRGKPQENNLESAFRLLDEERRAVVRTFDRLTTDELHAMWGKINVG